MNLDWIFQTVITIMIGALAWFIKRSFDDFKTSIKKLDTKLDTIDKKHGDKYDDLQKQLNNLEKDLPLVYTLREDFLRVMNSVDDKLSKILYGRNGGNTSD